MCLVTEHGLTYLKGETNSQRALALGNLAAPQFRQDLLNEAKKIGLLRQFEDHCSDFRCGNYAGHMSRRDDGFRPRGSRYSQAGFVSDSYRVTCKNMSLSKSEIV